MKVKFPIGLKELRFHLSQNDAASSHLRTVLNKWYPAMKKENPFVPILIRESQGAHPTAYARFELGRETKVPLGQETSPDAIEKRLKQLLESHGN